jgi:competence protein ComEC
LLVACALAFIVGVYIQAVYSFPLVSLLALLLLSLILIPLFLSKQRLLILSLLLLAFALAGSARLALLAVTDRVLPIHDTDVFYSGTVLETSQKLKVLRLTRPAEAQGLRVVVPGDTQLETGDRVQLLGRLRELEPSFKNPHTSSWKWIKRLEGINYGLKGKILVVRSGNNLIARLRNFFRTKIENSGALHTDVIKALTIGDRTSLSEEKNRLFLRTGTSHVLAISGFNVGIISGFFFFIARWFLRRRERMRLSGRDMKYAAILTIPFPFIFMLIAGAGISVIRATIMIIIYMFALLLERGRHVLNTMAVSAIVILLIYPHSPFMPSFQLTFLSLLAIVLCMDRMYPRIKTIPFKPGSWLLSAVLTTIAATLGTAPVVIYHFYGVNPLSFVHNLVTVPVMGVMATSLSLMGMAIPYGEHLLKLSGYLIDLNIVALRLLDWGYLFPIVRPSLYEIILYFALFLTLLYVGKKRAAVFGLILLIPLLFVQAYLVYDNRFHNYFRVNFIDVGVGESTLIEAPGGLRILVDGGGSYSGDFDSGSRVVMPFLLSRKILTLDYVVNSHPHGDHIGGLTSIIQNLKVRTFVGSAFLAEYPNLPALLTLLRGNGTNLVLWKRGEKHVLGDDLEVTVFHPPIRSSFENLNDASLVFKVSYKNHHFLFPGDIGMDVEEELVAASTELQSHVLKVAHHGSNSSNGYPFIRAVRPDAAILSAGGGLKNLPSPDTVDRFRQLSIPLFRTDKQGLVTVCSDGKKLTYTVFQR